MLNNLTAEHRHILQLLGSALGLIADLTNAEVTVYIQDNDKKFLYICAQERHLLQREMQRPNMTGRRVRKVEEPLATRVLQLNMPVEGKREVLLGDFCNFKVFPVRDRGGKCFAAISFAAADPQELLTEQALELLMNLQEPVQGNKYYERLTPNDGVLLVDLNKRIIAANDQAKHLFKLLDLRECIGRKTNDVEINWPLVGMVIDTGVAESKEILLSERLLSMRVLPVVPRPAAGCCVVILQDITGIRQKEEELRLQAVMLKEIHHRVKNNLQTIAGLLRLQARRAEHQETKDVLRSCIGRVNSIGIVHEYLSAHDSGMADVEKMLGAILQAVTSALLPPGFKLSATCVSDSILLTADKAVSLGLVVNELLQNSLEHGFKNRETGSLQVSFSAAPSGCMLTVEDDGIGLPPDFAAEKIDSMGLKIIRTVVEFDLRGNFNLCNKENGGTLAVVELPVPGGKNV